MYLISNSPIFTIFLFMLIVTVLFIITDFLLVKKQNSSIFQKLSIRLDINEKYFQLGVIALMLNIIPLFVAVTLLMFSAGYDMSENNIEKNIINKYGFSDVEMWSDKDKEQGVYLVTVFDKETFQKGIYEFWFDSETYEPNKSESDTKSNSARGIDKLLNRIDDLSK